MLGIAELTYPHPKGWTIAGASGCPTLDTLTVRVLTAVFRGKKEKPPTCIASWSARVPGRIPWHELGQMFQGGLLTPKDYSSYFKNVLHRCSHATESPRTMEVRHAAAASRQMRA